MEQGKRGLSSAVILFPLIFLVLISKEIDLWASPIQLDQEAVFDVYNRISGNDIEEQDIEDFYYSTGYPFFSRYKPAEMFTNKSLKESMVRFIEQSKRIDEDSRFIWGFNCTFLSKDSKADGYKIVFDAGSMPCATPYICSEITDDGIRSLKRILNQLAVKQIYPASKKEIKGWVNLMPKTVDYRFQARTIAGEDVILPVRSVLFQPVEVCFFDEIVHIETEF